MACSCLVRSRARWWVSAEDLITISNAAALAMHGYLTRDGIAPAELAGEGVLGSRRRGGAGLRCRVHAPGLGHGLAPRLAAALTLGPAHRRQC